MKRLKLNISANKLSNALLLLSVLFLFACSGKRSNPSADFSENGIGVSKMAVEVFNEFNNTVKNQQYQNEFIKIVNDLAPETYIMTIETDYDLEIQNLHTVKAYKNLERVFTAYKLQFDSNISIKASGLREKINTACNSLDSLKIDENIKEKNEQIKNHVKSSKFKADETLFQLVNIYSEIWASESQNWLSQLISFQDKTNKGIKQIPISAFNTEKIKTLIDEPFNNGAMLANLYKLKLIKENEIHILQLQERIHQTAETFDLLVAVQGELLKKKTDKLKVEELNNQLEMMVAN